MTDDLDLLLSRPLEEPDDATFTAQVLAKIGRRRQRDEWMTIGALALAACFAFAIVFGTPAGRTLALSASQLAYSVPFAVGIALLFLSRALLEAIPD
jgi:Mn2+/Fe2+ NRAMP family transporter